MATRANIETLTPGGRLKAELKKVGRTQKQFAAEMGIRPSHISEMLSNKRSISLPVAAKIEAVLGVPAKELLDLQVAFNMTNGEAAEEFAAGDTLTRLDELVSLRDLYVNNPVKRGTNTERLAYLHKEYGICTCEQVIKSCGFFKKSETTGLDTRKLRTWILTAQKALRRSDSALGVFSRDTLDEIKGELHEVFHENIDTINRVKSVLNRHGIKFVIVPKIDHASVDGYSCFDENEVPVIVVTLRFQRIDNLAFAVMHEICHIYKHLTAGDKPHLTFDDYEENNRGEEKEANAFAADALISNVTWRRLPPMPLNPYAIQKKCTAWAEDNHLNKWIVLGRVSHETGMYKFKQDDSRSIN